MVLIIHCSPDLTRVRIVSNGVEYCRKKVYFMKKTLALVIVLVLICSSFAVYADTNSEYNCSDWARESIDRAFNSNLLDSEKEYEFKTNISRLDFCGLIFNLVIQTPYFQTWCEENLEEDDTEKEYGILLDEKEKEYLYDLDDKKKEVTITFDDIKYFGSIKKVSKDGVISGVLTLVNVDNKWYWKSEVMKDDSNEYVIALPESLNKKLNAENN